MTSTTPSDAAEFARTTLRDEVGADLVGDHLAAEQEDARVTTHYFASTQPGYPGWRWAVTTVQIGDDEAPTIDDIVLLPGDEAILAPVWVPWRDRIRPGDMSPGDLLPVEEDDARLVPGYLAGDVDGDRELGKVVADEVGLGRRRVLSHEGTLAAADRWYSGDHGPHVPLAQSAPGACGNCGFLVRLAGPLSATFGVCANRFANDDGRVVSLDHGCGAHSEAQLRRKQLPPALPDHVFDTLTPDDLERF